MRPSAASSSRHRRSTWPDDRLPMIRDGHLTLELLARYAAEYDEHGEGTTLPAVAFVEYLALENRARLLNVPGGLQHHAAAPKTGQPRGRARRPL